MIGMLYAITTAPMVSGIVRAFETEDVWLVVRGASEAPKSTVFWPRAFMPAPLPID